MIKLNLLPKNLRKRVEPGWWRLVAVLFPLATFAVVAFVHTGTLGQIRTLESERDQLKLEVEVLRPFIQKQAELNRRKAELEEVIAVARQIEERFIPWSDHLARFINQIPRESNQFRIALDTVAAQQVPPQTQEAYMAQGLYDRKPVRVEFRVEGEALEEDALIRFVQAFEVSPAFGINFHRSSRDEQGLIRFNATIGLVAPKEEGGEARAQ